MADDRSSNRSSERVFNRAEAEEELIEGQETPSVPAAPRGDQQGISNHAAIEEEREQRKLPPRGQPKTDRSDA
jgi:hypothetical protein